MRMGEKSSQPISSMDEWDRVHGPRLQKIERLAWWLNHYADEIAYTATGMKLMPSFETKAEADLADAQMKVAAALKIIDDLPRERNE